jgi:hypothetical protein
MMDLTAAWSSRASFQKHHTTFRANATVMWSSLALMTPHQAEPAESIKRLNNLQQAIKCKALPLILFDSDIYRAFFSNGRPTIDYHLAVQSY